MTAPTTERPAPRELRMQGGLTWFAVLGAIGAWAVHLVAEAAITRFTCTEGALEWVMHAITVVTVAVAMAATWLAWRLARSGGDDEGAGTREGTARFLGLFGVITGITNVLLILLEGSYILFISPCA